MKLLNILHTFKNNKVGVCGIQKYFELYGTRNSEYEHEIATWNLSKHADRIFLTKRKCKLFHTYTCYNHAEIKKNTANKNKRWHICFLNSRIFIFRQAFHKSIRIMLETIKK